MTRWGDEHKEEMEGVSTDIETLNVRADDLLFKLGSMDGKWEAKFSILAVEHDKLERSVMVLMDRINELEARLEQLEGTKNDVADTISDKMP